jgi:6-phosphogluconolactonase
MLKINPQFYETKQTLGPEVYTGATGSLIERLADEFSREAARAIDRRGFFAVAIPGGSVAVGGFPALAALPIDWRRTHFFWVDERAVPPDHPESNFAVAQTHWLGPAHVPAESIHRMPAEGPDLAAAAVTYGEELTRVLGARPRLDFVLLGVGLDGHVASLFPGHAALLEEERLVVPVMDAPKPPARRLSLSMPMLTEAERVLVVAFDGSKADVIQEAVERKDSWLPVALVLRRARRPMVLSALA